jgi:cellulose biosynthesis protein BcsE
MFAQRFLPSLWPTKATAAVNVPAATLAIDGLPNVLDDLPIGCNTSLWGQDIPAMRVWQHSMLREMLARAPVVLLAPDAQRAQAIADQPDFNTALAQGHLKIWLLSEADQQKIAQDNGLLDFLMDMRAVGLSANHGLMCLDFFPLFHYTGLRDLSHLDRMLRLWAQKRRQPSVWFLLFRDAFQPAMERRSFLAHAFPYAATLQKDFRGLGLMINRWNSPQGAIFQTRYGLESPAASEQAPQRLKADGSVVYMHDSQQTIVAQDLATVYTTEACVQDLRLLPPDWVVLPNWEALETACQSAIAATVLIDVGRSERITALAHLVHRLRHTHPASFKIVLQETTDHLRIHTEEALSQLGMTTVIYKDSQFSRTVRRLHELQHTWFQGPVSDNVDAVLTTLTPIDNFGYHSPEKFCQLLGDFLDDPRRAKLDHSLVRLHLLPTVSHVMALQQLKLHRSGELVTNDSKGIVIFLYACREADMDKVLTRVFQQPLGMLFQSQESVHTIADMQHEIKKMHLSLQKIALPDYALALTKSSLKKDGFSTSSQSHLLKKDGESAISQPKLPLVGGALEKNTLQQKRTVWLNKKSEA